MNERVREMCQTKWTKMESLHLIKLSYNSKEEGVEWMYTEVQLKNNSKCKCIAF